MKTQGMHYYEDPDGNSVGVFLSDVAACHIVRSRDSLIDVGLYLRGGGYLIITISDNEFSGVYDGLMAAIECANGYDRKEVEV